METSINSKSDSIQVVYENYLKELYIVNRRYQRKLVWNLDEKKAFIDSINKQYSVPLFLLAQNGNDLNMKFEIIDGMQRLNAIISFIENEFPILHDGEYCYFNLQTLASTNNLMDKHILCQKKPILSRDECIKIVSYQLPFSYIIADEGSIEEIFRRINSFGKQLSAQEIRQAGALGRFPDLVRILAARIRGDISTSDRLVLNKMKTISLSSSKDLSYGINIEDIFWIKQNIITKGNIRVSRDEELIAWLLLYILLGSKDNPSSKTLDKLYHYEYSEDDLASQAEDQIEKMGSENILAWFIKVFDEICNILNKSNNNFRDLLFADNKSEGLVRSFQIVYLAFYELIINENKIISDSDGLVKALKNIGTNHFKGISGSAWNAQIRQQKIQAVKGIISRYFSMKEKIEDVAIENWVSQLENLLSKSIIEGSLYDFKMGFHSVSGKNSDKKFNEDLLKKCIKILTAEVNKGPHTKGYVIIGVAESKETADNYHNIYKSNYKRFRDTKFFITGLQDEIKLYHQDDGDTYIREIKKVIKKEPLDAKYINYILANMKLISYYDKLILVLELQSFDEPVIYDNGLYKREGNDTLRVDGMKEITAIQDLF